MKNFRHLNYNLILFCLIFTLIFIYQGVGWLMAAGEEVTNPGANPAAKYCSDLGFKWQIENKAEGQVGICIMPDGQRVEEWDFVTGRAGQEFSYCQKKGYRLEPLNNNPICQSVLSKDCAVCVLANGYKYEATKLMSVESRPEKCGDNFCTNGETAKNCPKDCQASNEANFGKIIFYVLLIIFAALLFIFMALYLKNKRLFFIIILLFFGGLNQVQAAASLSSPDAIGFRVMPNPDHFSPRRWYQENIKLKGSPQALAVDGYEAVRDGRTVYANAANVVDANNDGVFNRLDNLYTNIYIISYNQQAENETVDIFGQILAHWKFNSNIADQQVKAAIIRDTKRLADLADIKIALADYQKAHNGDYPNLSAGSYLAGKSISTWPSWQATLGKELAITLPVDPINKLGSCSGYNDTTCWNQTTKQFADPTNDSVFNLPTNSRAYVYQYNTNNTYKICALIESSYANIAAESCYDVASGQAIMPTINCGSATAKPNTAFTGFVSVSGPDAAKFTRWTVNPISPNSWASPSDSWASRGWQWDTGAIGLKLTNTSDNKTKKVTALKTPFTGDYSYQAIVSVPNSGLSANATCDIKVACAPSCPSPSDVCLNTTDDASDDGCGGHCNVVGAGITTCNTFCFCNAPSNSEVNASGGVCCGGQTCYKCAAGYSWDNNTNTCVENCGNGKVDPGEACDTALPPQSCTGTFGVADGLPLYCSGISASGTRTCNAGCGSLGACKLALPTVATNTSEACANTSPEMKDNGGYACCELISCDGDACGCCGRPWFSQVNPPNLAHPWMISVSGEVLPIGYTKVKGLVPQYVRNPGNPGQPPSRAGLCSVANTGYNADLRNVGIAGVPNVIGESCKLMQSDANPKNWQILTEHTMASYKCWR